MKNNLTAKNYRGFKYILLVLLISTAIGTFFLSKGGQQLDDPQAKLKEAASSLTAGVSEKGRGLADKAGETKKEVAESLTQDRDRETATAPGVTQTGQDAVASDTDGKIEEMKVTVKDTAEIIAATAGEQGQRLMDKSEEFVETPAQESLQAGTDTSAVPDLEGDWSQSTTNSETFDIDLADSGSTDTMAPDSTSDPAATSASDADNVLTQQASEQQPATMDPKAGTATANQTQFRQAAVQVGENPGSALRCVGPPPMGKDLGTVYIVASCETLSIISQRTGIGLEKIKDSNPQITNPDLIHPNQELRLPPRS